MKNVLITLTLLSVVLVSGCRKDDFVEIKGVCPEVILTSPLNGASGVPINKVVTATFNEKMNPATITKLSFTLNGSPVAGTVSYTDSTASFTPDTDLLINHLYTARITTAVKDPRGNALQEDYVWTFTTGPNIAPIVILTDPANNETGVYLNKKLTATFDVPMDPLTIDQTSFILRQGTQSIQGIVDYSGTTASFRPYDLLLANTTYTAIITDKARNVSGTSMSNNYIWTFITGDIIAPAVSCLDPADGATDVVFNKIISVCFNDVMNPLTLNSSTFMVKQGTTTVGGTISYVDSFATFTPANLLLSGTIYTVTITAGVENTQGIPIANDLVWSFTVKN